MGWLEGGTAVFAFRGTASRQDGLQDVKIFSRNIDYLQELYPGVKAHLGVLPHSPITHSCSCSCSSIQSLMCSRIWFEQFGGPASVSRYNNAVNAVLCLRCKLAAHAMKKSLLWTQLKLDC